MLIKGHDIGAKHGPWPSPLDRRVPSSSRFRSSTRDTTPVCCPWFGPNRRYTGPPVSHLGVSIPRHTNNIIIMILPAQNLDGPLRRVDSEIITSSQRRPPGNQRLDFVECGSTEIGHTLDNCVCRIQYLGTRARGGKG